MHTLTKGVLKLIENNTLKKNHLVFNKIDKEITDKEIIAVLKNNSRLERIVLENLSKEDAERFVKIFKAVLYDNTPRNRSRISILGVGDLSDEAIKILSDIFVAEDKFDSQTINPRIRVRTLSLGSNQKSLYPILDAFNKNDHTETIFVRGKKPHWFDFANAEIFALSLKRKCTVRFEDSRPDEDVLQAFYDALKKQNRSQLVQIEITGSKTNSFQRYIPAIKDEDARRTARYESSSSRDGSHDFGHPEEYLPESLRRDDRVSGRGIMRPDGEEGHFQSETKFVPSPSDVCALVDGNQKLADESKFLKDQIQSLQGKLEHTQLELEREKRFVAFSSTENDELKGQIRGLQDELTLAQCELKKEKATLELANRQIDLLKQAANRGQQSNGHQTGPQQFAGYSGTFVQQSMAGAPGGQPQFRQPPNQAQPMQYSYSPKFG